MYDFLITAFAVAVGILLAIGLYDLAVQAAHSCSAARKARRERDLARKRDEEMEANAQLRVEFVRDGWTPPEGWSVNSLGFWEPEEVSVVLQGETCPAAAPEARLQEVREESRRMEEELADSYWP